MVCLGVDLDAVPGRDERSSPGERQRAGTAPGGARAPSADQTSGEGEAGKDRALEEVNALGYVSWDSEADRSLRGVTVNVEGRAAPGYNIYTDDVSRIFLTDLQGKQVHEWKMPVSKRWCEHAELLENGDLLVLCVNRSLTRIDWSGKILWDRSLAAHHDVAVLPDGSFAALSRRERAYQGRHVYFDEIVTLSGDGERLRRWSTFDDLEELLEHHSPVDLDNLPAPPFDRTRKAPVKIDYYHMNSLEALPATPLGERDRRFRAGNLLVSFRNADLIAVLDQESYEVQWSWGTETLDFPHMPTMLESGNILVFDNGARRGFSRVLEIRPPKGKIIWKYRGKPAKAFYSRWRGGNQRLSNGNTLICESERGHVLEVAPKGEIVWEFWNPEIKSGKRKRIYRFMRLPPRLVDPLLRRTGDTPADEPS
jgi:hypothetical protein